MIKTKRFLNYITILNKMLSLKAEKQLRNLGLNSYEVKIWTALLSRGVSTAGELSDIANVPRSRSYDVLESLEKKGFVAAKWGKPLRYAATAPQAAIESIKSKTMSNAAGEIGKINNIKKSRIIGELNSLHAKGKSYLSSSDTSGALIGRYNIHNHTRQMLEKAKKSILISATSTEFTAFVENFKPILESLGNKNVKIRIFTQPSQSTRKKAAEISQFAEVINTGNKARFCIVDGSEIIFMLLDDSEVHPTYDVGVWVGSALAKDIERVYSK